MVRAATVNVYQHCTVIGRYYLGLGVQLATGKKSFELFSCIVLTCTI